TASSAGAYLGAVDLILLKVGWGEADGGKKRCKGAVFGDERLKILLATKREALVMLIRQGKGLLEGKRCAGSEIDLRSVFVEDFAIARHFLLLIEMTSRHRKRQNKYEK